MADDFLQRVESWKAGFDLPPFRPNQDTASVLPPPVGSSVPAARMQPGNGITTGERYAKQARLQEMYMEIIPDQRPLARELSHEDEAEIFRISTSPIYYRDNVLKRLKTLDQQVQFAKAFR
jgi:hypothetical protein